MTINIRCNLHGFTLEDAREETIKILNACWKAKKYCLTFIHGHNRGHVLRDYLRSEKFLVEMQSEGFLLFRGEMDDPGITIFIMKNSSWTDNNNDKSTTDLNEKKLELKKIAKKKIKNGSKIDIFEARALYGEN